MYLLPICKLFMVLYITGKKKRQPTTSKQKNPTTLDDVNASSSTITNCPVDPKYSKSQFYNEYRQLHQLNHLSLHSMQHYIRNKYCFLLQFCKCEKEMTN